MRFIHLLIYFNLFTDVVFSFLSFVFYFLGSSTKGAKMDMGDGVTSIAWCGASLLLSSRAGAVSFLLPYPSIHSSLSSYTTPSSQYLLNNDNNNENNSRNRSKNENESNYHHSMIQSLGFRLDRTCASSTDNRSLSYGLLCSLPRHLTSSGL